MFVLVVDDDEDFLLLCRRALEARGHEAETTSTAFGLVNRAAGANGARRPDAVVLDCDLPGLTGFSAVELLSRDRRTAGIPILLVSAAESPHHHEAASTNPLAIFVQKDGHLRSLVGKLEAHASEVLSQVAVATKRS